MWMRMEREEQLQVRLVPRLLRKIPDGEYKKQANENAYIKKSRNITIQLNHLAVSIVTALLFSSVPRSRRQRSEDEGGGDMPE